MTDGDDPAGLGERRFIESVGLFFEDAGIPRIGGRLLGLLMLVDRPLSLDEIAEPLLVSRGSVSTNARLLLTAGIIERVSLPGDRRDYYAFSTRAWEGNIQTDIKTGLTLRRLTEEGLAGLDPSNRVGRERLREAAAFGEFYARELTGVLERWRARVAGQLLGAGTTDTS